MSICSRKMVKSPVFNQPCCHCNSTHPSQNARMNTSVVNIDLCNKWASKHKNFKSNGEFRHRHFKTVLGQLKCLSFIPDRSYTVSKKTMTSMHLAGVFHITVAT